MTKSLTALREKEAALDKKLSKLTKDQEKLIKDQDKLADDQCKLSKKQLDSAIRSKRFNEEMEDQKEKLKIERERADRVDAKSLALLQEMTEMAAIMCIINGMQWLRQLTSQLSDSILDPNQSLSILTWDSSKSKEKLPIYKHHP